VTEQVGAGAAAVSTLAGLLGRVLGAVAIACGTIIVGFNPNRFDVVLFDLPVRTGHGVHLHDVLGVALVALGTLVLWLAPSTSESRGGD
jgi:hypothetical protein